MLNVEKLFLVLMALSVFLSMSAGTILSSNGLPDMGAITFSGMIIINAYTILFMVLRHGS